MQKNKGQITFGILAMIAPFLFAAIGFGWNAMGKADSAVKEVSNVRVDVAEIKSDVRWIRETLSNQKVLGTTTSSKPYNGYQQK